MVCDLKEKTPRHTVISKRGHLTWSSEDMDSLTEDIDQASTPKKRRLCRMNSQEEMTLQIKNEDREGQNQNLYIVCRCDCAKFVLSMCTISFSVSFEALEPYYVSE